MKRLIITGVHNNKNITSRCVESIKKNTAGLDYEHIIIDNNSTDGTREYLKAQDVILIENKENKGCAFALNQGVRAASGKYICNADNDVVVSREWIEPLIEFAERDEKAGIISPGTREGKLDYDFESYAAHYVKKMKNLSKKEFGRGGACL
ncbi:MAG: glycosyltransferase [Candidatus Goldiibacteriota bacterium]